MEQKESIVSSEQYSFYYEFWFTHKPNFNIFYGISAFFFPRLIQSNCLKSPITFPLPFVEEHLLKKALWFILLRGHRRPIPAPLSGQATLPTAK